MDHLIASETVVTTNIRNKLTLAITEENTRLSCVPSLVLYVSSECLWLRSNTSLEDFWEHVRANMLVLLIRYWIIN